MRPPHLNDFVARLRSYNGVRFCLTSFAAKHIFHLRKAKGGETVLNSWVACSSKANLPMQDTTIYYAPWTLFFVISVQQT